MSLFALEKAYSGIAPVLLSLCSKYSSPIEIKIGGVNKTDELIY